MIRVRAANGNLIGVRPESVIAVVPGEVNGAPVIGTSEVVVLAIGPMALKEAVDDVIDKVNEALKTPSLPILRTLEDVNHA